MASSTAVLLSAVHMERVLAQAGRAAALDGAGRDAEAIEAYKSTVHALLGLCATMPEAQQAPYRLKAKEYKQCAEDCTACLRHNGDSVKALYRRCQVRVSAQQRTTAQAAAACLLRI